MEEEKQIEREQKQQREEFKRLRASWHCFCGYQAKGLSIKEKNEDILKHKINNHPELRPYNL